MADAFGAGEEGRDESEWEENSSRLPLDEFEKETLWPLVPFLVSFGRCQRNFCF